MLDSFARSSLAVAAAALLAAPALAQQPAATGQQQARDPGAEAYRLACAQCHGPEARGDGPLRSLLNIQSPDLTTLRQRNNGEFPFYRVFQMVDGRTMIPAHGTREMPAWGAVFAIDIGDQFGPYARETLIRGRIVELVRHIESLQR